MNILKKIINITFSIIDSLYPSNFIKTLLKNNDKNTSSINTNCQKYNFNNVDLAEQLFNTQVLGKDVDFIYKNQINKILKQYPERQQILLKVVELIGEPSTPKERFLVAKAYAWSRVQYREKAIYYLELYLNNELYEEAYIHQYRNINDTVEIRKKYHLNEMYGYLAKAYVGIYNFDKALEIYEYLITIFPQNPTAYRGKYDCLVKQNKLKECSSWIDSLKKLTYYKFNANYTETSPENWFYFTINELQKDIKDKIDKGYIYKSRTKK